MTGRPAPPLRVRLARQLVRVLPRGRYRLAHAAWVRRNVPPFVGTIAPHGRPLRLLCDLRDIVTREAYLVGVYEPQETLLLHALLRRGDVMVDVGANWGYFTLLAAQAVGPQGQVHAFEPDPRVHALLAANLELNALSHVATHQVAVADQRGSAVLRAFTEDTGNYGISHLVQAAPAATDYQVETVPLDEMFGHLPRGAIRVLKMDIEGGERAALAGARDLVQRHVAAFVLVEIHPAALGPDAARVEDGLRAAGYQGWGIDHRPAMSRRAARRGVGWRETLLPLGGDEPWPHHLWVAPGVTLPGPS